MKKRLFFLIAFLPLVGFTANTPPPQEKVWMRNLQGIYLLGDPCLVKASPEPFCGVRSVGVLSDRKLEDLEDELRENYLCRSLTECGLEEMKCAILEYFKRGGYRFVDVVIPPQEITNCVLQILIVQTKLCNVEVCGNEWTSEDRLKNYLQVKPGGPIKVDSVLRSLTWMNRNPFRRVDALFAPGSECGTTNIQLLVDERRPYRAYYGWDDRGNEAIGNYRQFLGVNWGNPFFLDGSLTFQVTVSSHLKKLQAYTARYESYFPWGDTLSFYGGYSHVHSEHLGFSFHNHGYSYQGSFRYDISIRPKGYMMQNILVGADFKSTNNNLEFSEVPIFSKIATLLQLVAGYRLQLEPTWASVLFKADVMVSPNFNMPHQNATDYSSLRPFAKPFYIYMRALFESTLRLAHKWCFITRIQGQASSRNLLPSEEFGLGGMDTVRGYEERIANGDQGALMNLEFFTPSFTIFQNCGNCVDGNCVSCEDRFMNRCCSKIKDGLKFLVFADLGTTAVHKRLPGENKGETLIGIGPGLRYIMEPYLSFQADYGFRLSKVEDNNTGDGRFHFIAIASF